MKETIEKLNKQFKDATPEEVLTFFLDKYKTRIALASSLSIEDQAITDMITKIDSQCRIFTLDTGRLFPETYSLIDDTNKKYSINIELFFPQNDRVEEMVAKYGVNLFYDSVENRKRCCDVRKMEPLKRAFKGLDVWICGLRQEQSVTRYGTNLVEFDEANNIIKLNPLIVWSEEMTWNYIKKNNVPYNKLHDCGFPSIGCQPCTKAISKGDDIRAGRWWWEAPLTKECGLHVKK